MSWTLLITIMSMSSNKAPQSHVVVNNIPTYEACVEVQKNHISQLEIKWHQVASTCIQTITK
jgi:hypothetical protein